MTHIFSLAFLPAVKNLSRSMIAAGLILPMLLSSASADDEKQTAWLVNTRFISKCGDLHDAYQGIRYSRMEACNWVPSCEVDFHRKYTGPMVVFISGNQTDAEETVVKGCFLHSMVRDAAEDRAFRFVIWSWPADRVCRRHRGDAQLKVHYSKAESYFLAEWLDRLPAGEEVCLIGHSLGARIIGNAMHLLAGGEVAGRTMPQPTVDRWKTGKQNRVNAVLLAAAVDADCLARGEQCDAFSLLEKILVTKNGCDWALKWYPRLWGRGGPQAMGFVGPSCFDSTKVEVIDVSGTVGKSHDCMVYCSALDTCNFLARYAFFEE